MSSEEKTPVTAITAVSIPSTPISTSTTAVGSDCAVCLSQYSDPRVLICGHSFCLACLQAASKSVRKSPCPICARHLVPPTSAVADLPKNYALSSILEGRRKRVECSECGDAVLRRRMMHCRKDGALVCSCCIQENHSGHGEESLAEWHSSELRKQLTHTISLLESIASLASEAMSVTKLTEQVQSLAKVLPIAFEAALSPLVMDTPSSDLQPPRLESLIGPVEAEAKKVECALIEHVTGALASLEECGATMFNLLLTFPINDSIKSINLYHRNSEVEEYSDPGPDLASLQAHVTLRVEDAHRAAIVGQVGMDELKWPDWPWSNLRQQGIVGEEKSLWLLLAWCKTSYDEQFPLTETHLDCCSSEIHADAHKTFDLPSLHCLLQPS